MFGKSEQRDDYQNTRRAVVAMARDLAPGYHIAAHEHRRSQLLYCSSGVMTVSTEAGAWVVPPHRGVWVPGGVRHELTASGHVRLRTVYIEPDARADFPVRCAVLTISPLLRELMLSAVRIPNDYSPGSREERLMMLILDELVPSSELPLHLPMPADRRLLKLCEYLIERPDSRSDLRALGVKFGASQRTLERLFPAETGMTFSLWRQQARVLAAIRLLAEGHSIASVALDVGYESPSAFTVMFRRAFGVAPSDYYRSYVSSEEGDADR